MSDSTLLLRILVAAALGGILGIERELRDQPAGFRTHILLSVGSCLFTIVGAFGFEAFKGDAGGVRLQGDPTRVAAQIVAGIGFLGGGAILKYGANVRGLTTAASLWATAAIGTAVGLGFYFASTATALVAVFSLAGLKPIERRFLRRGSGASPPPSLPPD